MRVFLALAALGLCVFEGLRKSSLMKKRADFLSEILTMLGNFSSEITLRAPTFEQLVESEKCAFARAVSEQRASSPDIKTAWENACAALPQKNEEAAVLSEFGKSLINSGSDSARDIIAVYSEKIARLEKLAREEYSQKGGAFRKIWTLCGIAAAVLIV